MLIIKDKKDIEKVFKSGNFGCNGFLCSKFNQNGLEYSRIAISIGLKFSKKAVERNRAKRVLREAIRKNYGKIKSGYDLVFYLKNAKPEDVDYKNISEALNIVLEKSNLFKHA